MEKESGHAVDLGTTEDEQCGEPPGNANVVTTNPQALNTKSESSVSRKGTPFACDNWNDWKWQIKHQIRSAEQLIQYLPALKSQTELIKVIQKYPMAITPYYASLIQKADISDPIFAMCVPQPQELINPPCLSEDPLEEHQDMPVPGLVHRYPDRALLIVTTTCASYCRHCTRKRVAGKRDLAISPRRLQQVIDYLQGHPEICDVILSGGDPLTMSTEMLETVLSRLRSVESVQIIRIGTRVPVVMPMRITDELTEMLSKYHPIWVNTHFNHPNELTKESAMACAKLANSGMPIGNQTVLLRGVNDNPQTIEKLCRGLVGMRVRPYYMYQCDLVQGIEHFRTPLNKGIEIMEYLRGRVSGLAIPNFVVDCPHGGGKIPVLPNYVISMSPTHTVLRNYEGMIVNYPEPTGDNRQTVKFEQEKPINTGVWEISCGATSVIQPVNTNRGQRRQKITERKKQSLKWDDAFLFELY